MVSDLRHFLDVSEGAPVSARRLAHQFRCIVQAATAGEMGSSWTTGLTCIRRPGRRPCPGRIIVRRRDADDPIEWQCSVCADAGVITGWAETPFDLRRLRPRAVEADRRAVLVSGEAAAELRSLKLLDRDGERLVFGAKASGADVVISGAREALEELTDSVAAEANHENNRRRQKRLDDAFDALSSAI